MSAQREAGPGTSHIPEAHGAVFAARGEGLAVRCEGQGMYPLGVTGQRGLEAKSGRVPEFYFPRPAELGMHTALLAAVIAPATSECQAVRGKDHRIHAAWMGVDAAFLLAGRHVPGAESVIPAGS